METKQINLNVLEKQLNWEPMGTEKKNKTLISSNHGVFSLGLVYYIDIQNQIKAFCLKTLNQYVFMNIMVVNIRGL